MNNDPDRLTPYGVMDRVRELDNFHLTAEYGNFSFKNWYWHIKQKMGIGAGIIGNESDRDISDALKFQLNWENKISENLQASYDVSFSHIELDASFQLFPPGVWPVGDDGNLLVPPFTFVNFPDGVIGEPKLTSERTKFNSALVYSKGEEHRFRIGFGYEQAELVEVREFKNFGPGVLDVNNIPQDPDFPDEPLLPVSDVIVDVTGTPSVYTPEYTRELWYISLQDEWRFAKNWELTAGIRLDDYSDFGSTTNPRVALVWNSSDSITSKLLFGTAFRAPKSSEVAFINNPTTIGNPNLDPEKIKTLELGFDYRPVDEFYGQLNIFRYEAEDLIQL